MTGSTITRRATLRRELAEARTRGWAHSLGEFEDGLHGMAAPIVDAAGVFRAALCVSGPMCPASTTTWPLP